MSRFEFTNATKRDAFVRAKGKCEGCGFKLRSGEAHYEHIVAEWLTRDNSLDNCQVLCVPCHKHKTGKRDVPMIAKAKRVRDREQGIKSRSSFQTNRDGPFKAKIGGGVVRRGA